jgi:hypothetical protein
MAKVSAGVNVSQFEDHPQGSNPPRRAAAAWHLGWSWPIFGTAGSLLMTLSGPRLSDTGTANWWYLLNVPPDRAANMAAFYLGLVALSVAWLGLGRRLWREPGTRPAELVFVGVFWAVPLAIGPALFSGDMYSYLAQGTILHLGLDPYHVAPVALVHLGRAHLLEAVSPFWRHTTAPYGPLFLGIVSAIAGATGSHLVAGILLVRVLEIAGIVLLAVFVPRLARTLGTDACRATWLAVISPLVLVELVAAGHNDALMAGLMVAGVTLARERHPLAGVAFCTLAATIKVPAGLAVVFIVASVARDLPTRTAIVRFVTEAIAIAVVVAAIVSATTGLGIGWISTSLLSTPGKVHLAITPVTAIGWSIAKALHLVGVTLSATRLESAVGDVAVLATAALGLVLLWRARSENFVLYLAVVLFAAAFAGPAAWPWYFCWGLVLFSCLTVAQKSRWLPIAIAACVFLVKPDGILVLPVQAASGCLAFYVALGLTATYRCRHRPGQLVVPRATGG